MKRKIGIRTVFNFYFFIHYCPPAVFIKGLFCGRWTMNERNKKLKTISFPSFSLGPILRVPQIGPYREKKKEKEITDPFQIGNQMTTKN